jgi:hypothetical protein
MHLVLAIRGEIPASRIVIVLTMFAAMSTFSAARCRAGISVSGSSPICGQVPGKW